MRPFTSIFALSLLVLAGCGRTSKVLNRPGNIAELKARAAHGSDQDRAFHVQGVVTFADPLSDFFVIQDSTGGLRISLPKGITVKGDSKFAEVSGVFSREGSDTSFLASDVVVGPVRSLPSAVPLAIGLSKAKDQVFRRVALNGVIESVNLFRPGLEELILKSGSERLRIRAVLMSASDIDSFPGAGVHLTGVLLPRGATDGRAIELWTSDIHNVEVLQPAVIPAAPAASANLFVIRTAAEVHRLAPEKAALDFPVELIAVITFYDPLRNRFFVQDKTDGMYVQMKSVTNSSLRAGDLVKIIGVSHPGDFAPTVSRAEVSLLGKGLMPAAEPDVEAAFMGQRDSRWLTLRGVVQDVTETQSDVILNLVWGKHTFRAHVLAPIAEVRPLIDREIVIEGACGSLFNNRRQVLGIQLFVPGMKFIQPKSPPTTDPFLLPLSSASALLQFSQNRDIGHRAHIQGIVTLASRSGPTWIRDGSQGLMIADHNTLDIRDGDIVDVVGFPSAGQFGPFLKSAAVRKVRSGPPAAPVLTTADDASKGVAESQLIQLPATVVDTSVHDGVRSFRLKSGSEVFSANISDFEPVPKLSPFAKVRVTGICSVNTDDTEGTLLARGFRLNLRSAADIVILRDGPWFTPGRLAFILIGSLLLASAALFWVALLRKNVRRQTQNLLTKSCQLEAANAIANQALERAREAESLEQSRRHLLELVANDEPLDRIMTEIALAAERHSKNALCALRIELSDGTRLTASPSTPVGMPTYFDAPAGIGRLHVPVVVGGHQTGIMVLISSQGSPFTTADEALFPSWAQFATLAIERRGLYETLSFRAQYDALTGLLNRASLYEKLSQELASAKRNDTMLAVLYIDLNGFKAVNDTYGHDVGDLILREVSERMLKSVRRSDVVARLGGDEFAIVLSQLPAREESERVAHLLRYALSAPIEIDGKAIYCGGSLGVALYPSDADRADLLLKKADQQMYVEKSAGKKSRTRELAISPA